MATPVSAARKKSERSDDFMLPLGPTGEWREAEETAKPRNIWKKMSGKNVMFIHKVFNKKLTLGIFHGGIGFGCCLKRM